MEEAKGEELLQVALHSALGEQLAVDAQLVQLGRAVDLGAGRVLHRQHVLARVGPQNLWHLPCMRKIMLRPEQTALRMVMWRAAQPYLIAPQWSVEDPAVR